MLYCGYGVLWDAVASYNVLCCTALWCTVLCTILCCAYYAVLHVMLYCTAVCCGFVLSGLCCELLCTVHCCPYADICCAILCCVVSGCVSMRRFALIYCAMLTSALHGRGLMVLYHVSWHLSCPIHFYCYCYNITVATAIMSFLVLLCHVCFLSFKLIKVSIFFYDFSSIVLTCLLARC